MNASQMKWSASHDWYMGASLKNGIYSIMVIDTEHNERLTFTDFDELSIWAGY